MATTLIGQLANQLVGQRSFRVTGSGGATLSDIGVKDVTIQFTSRLLMNTSESGQPIIDSRVIMPTRISVNVVCNSADRVAEVNSLLMNLDQVFTIMSRGIKLENFMLDTESLTQSAAMLSATPMRIGFKKVMLQGGGSPLCAQAGDSSTVIGGIRNAATVAEGKLSQLKDSLTASAQQFFGG